MNNAILLNAIIENAIDGIIIIDAQGNIRLANPSVCELFGYTPDELIGSRIEMLMTKSDQLHHQDSVDQYNSTGKGKIIGIGREVTGLKKNGEPFPFRLAVSEMVQGKEVLFAGIVHDLTKEKQADEYLRHYATDLEATVRERTFALEDMVRQMREARNQADIALKKEKEINQLKTRFVSMASHEFRSPLSGIQLSASLIEHYYDRLDKAKVLNHTEKIKMSVSDLTNTLSDFLSVEKIEAGRVEPLYHDVDLTRFAKNIVEEMRMLARQGQTIRYHHTGTQSNCRVDENLLKHCIVNLLTNAIKYTADNGLIELRTILHGNKCVVLVKDNGIGIPEEDKQNLFKPFFRANNVRDIPGTGLGLNIVERYLALMGGTITFASNRLSGTVFTISIPLTNLVAAAQA